MKFTYKQYKQFYHELYTFRRKNNGDPKVIEIELSVVPGSSVDPDSGDFKVFVGDYLLFDDQKLTFLISYQSLLGKEFFTACQEFYNRLVQRKIIYINGLKIKIKDIPDQEDSIISFEKFGEILTFSFEEFSKILTNSNDSVDSKMDTKGNGKAVDMLNPQIGEYPGSEDEYRELSEYVRQSYARMAQNEKFEIKIPPMLKVEEYADAILENIFKGNSVRFSTTASFLQDPVAVNQLQAIFYDLAENMNDMRMADTISGKLFIKFEGEVQDSVKETILKAFRQLGGEEDKSEQRVSRHDGYEAEASYSGASRISVDVDRIGVDNSRIAVDQDKDRMLRDFTQDCLGTSGCEDEAVEPEKKLTFQFFMIDENSTQQLYNITNTDEHFSYIYVVSPLDNIEVERLNTLTQHENCAVLLLPTLTDEQAQFIINRLPADKVYGFTDLKESRNSACHRSLVNEQDDLQYFIEGFQKYTISEEQKDNSYRCQMIILYLIGCIFYSKDFKDKERNTYNPVAMFVSYYSQIKETNTYDQTIYNEITQKWKKELDENVTLRVADGPSSSEMRVEDRSKSKKNFNPETCQFSEENRSHDKKGKGRAKTEFDFYSDEKKDKKGKGKAKSEFDFYSDGGNDKKGKSRANTELGFFPAFVMAFKSPQEAKALLEETPGCEPFYVALNEVPQTVRPMIEDTIKRSGANVESNCHLFFFSDDKKAEQYKAALSALCEPKRQEF